MRTFVHVIPFLLLASGSHAQNNPVRIDLVPWATGLDTVSKIASCGDDRLFVVNLGPTLPLYPMPEPLLAPPAGSGWKLLWHSEDPRYGGNGMIEPEGEHSWRLPAHALAVLTPQPLEEADG